MREELSHRGCGAGSDQSMECFVRIHWVGQCSDCEPALLSVRGKGENSPDLEANRKLYFISFTTRVIRRLGRFSEQ